MEHITEVKNLLQKSIDVLSKAKRMEEEYMFCAQKLGLQGEKRRLRYESSVNHNLINFLRCDSFDVYSFELICNVQNINIQIPPTVKDFFESYLMKLENEYDVLHDIANKLVVSNAQHAAKHLYDKCRCIIEDIKYYKRTLLEGNATGWKPEFIFLHQTTGCNVHDFFEEKERETGYNY